MTMKIGNHNFEGPYTSTNHLANASGVYVILCQNNGNYNTIDVGESGDIKDRIEHHERGPCWKRNCNSTLSAAVLYTPNMTADQRRGIESAIRKSFNFPCGLI